MKTNKQVVLETLGLNKGAGLGLVFHEAQKYFNTEFMYRADPTVIELVYDFPNKEWACLVVWKHHDGDIVEQSAGAGTPWHAVYNCLADYLRTLGTRATMPDSKRLYTR